MSKRSKKINETCKNRLKSFEQGGLGRKGWEELQSVCRKKWRLDLLVFGNYCNRRFVAEMALVCLREKKDWWGNDTVQGQCRIAGTTAPEKCCYRTEVWSLLSARHPCLEELEVISMEKPRGRILLMLWSDIFCLILKGNLMLTVKSISNQDWNLVYDCGQWTPYCWSHKWCHISAVLWLPIFSPEIPILIKNFNLKGKVSLADSEKHSFVLLMCSWSSMRSRRQFTSFSAPSCPPSKALSEGKPTIYTMKASLIWELRRAQVLSWPLEIKECHYLWTAQAQSILCTSNTTSLGLGSPLSFVPPLYHWAIQHVLWISSA